MAATVTAAIDVDNKLTSEIFSILENNFLFGCSPTRSKLRILTIDADGSTQGILAAYTLLHLQSILRRKSASRTAHISDFFDVVAGSGAGGILAALLFTRGRDGSPIFTAEESLKFVFENYYSDTTGFGLFSKRRNKNRSVVKKLKKVFGDLTLKDAIKPVLIPCYDLKTGAPFVFSRADALEMDGCDFKMSGVCGATVAVDQAVDVKSTNGRRKIVGVGGGVGMSNPTAAAITHVLNNKQEFPMCTGVEDLLVLSLGNGEDHHSTSFLNIAADGAADMVDEAVSMAFGEWRRTNYVRIQGRVNDQTTEEDIKRKVEKMLAQKNVESVLFKGKKMVDSTNKEKLESMAIDLIKEQERRNNCNSPTRLSSSSSSLSSSTLSSH